MALFVFDIETVPDVESGRRLLDLLDLSDEEIAKAMFAHQQEKSGNTFIRHHLQKIVAISVVLRTDDQFQVWTLGNEDADEAEILTRFFAGIEKMRPVLISWNGAGFDLPVIHYRSLLHGIAAPQYWETGEHQQDFKWNNYLNRYHNRHCDLMDVLSGFQSRACASLNDMTTMLGYPGKLGMDGGQVWTAYCEGDITSIRNYCETDVVNTYLVYCRYEIIRGNMTMDEYEKECDLIAETLASLNRPHWQAFLEAWQR